MTDLQERLDSWKEIAAYLGVSVRTAQLWERERDLPVHRLTGGRRSRVFAYAHEIEAWLNLDVDPENGAAASPDPTDAGEPAPADDRQVSSRARRRPFVRTVMLSMGLLSVAILFAVDGLDRSRPIDRIEVEAGRVTAFGPKGDVHWSVELDDLSRDGPYASTVEDRYLIHDVDGDGADEVLFVWLHEHRVTDGASVALLRAGEVVWKSRVGHPLALDGDELPTGYVVERMALVEVEGRALLWTQAKVRRRYSTILELRDPASGAIVDVYRHPGYLYAYRLTDIDDDPDPELVMGGINNPGTGPGRPALLALDLPFSAAGPAIESVFDGVRDPRTLAYFLFPRPDVADVLDQRVVVSNIWDRADRELMVELVNTGVATKRFRYAVHVDFAESPPTVVPASPFSDQVIEIHRELELDGRLDHEVTEDELRALAEVSRHRAAPNANLIP